MKTLILTLIFFCCLCSLRSQNHEVNFFHLDTRNGLANNWVTDVFRDSHGFVWFGTFNGLNRFDGSNFELFENNPNDKNTLSNNTVNSIAEDKEGNVWFGTQDGLNVFDYKTFTFKRLRFDADKAKVCQYTDDVVNCVRSDNSNNIWIGTRHGLFLYHPTLKTATHTKAFFFDKTGCGPINNILHIQVGPLGELYMVSADNHLIKFNYKNNAIESFDLNVGNSGNLLDVKKILFLDHQNDLWIGCPQGLLLFHPRTNTFNKLVSDQINKAINSKLIEGISQDEQHRIWVATDGEGLAVVDKKDFSVRKIKHELFREESLASNGLSTIYHDRTGVCWIGHRRQGINFYKNSFNKFKLYKHNASKVNTLSNSDVNCVFEDSKGLIWVGSNGGGVDVFDRDDRLVQHYEYKEGVRNGLSSNKIVCIFQDHEGIFWIGTYFGGLNRFDPKTKTFTVYKHSDKDPFSISDDRVWNVYEDSHSNLWISTLGGGLNLLDRATGKFTRYTESNSNLSNNCVFSTVEDCQHRLWVCSAYGLMQFDSKSQTFTRFINVPNDSRSISSSYSNALFCDSRKWIWVATNKGLNLFNPSTKSFRSFTKAQGMPSDIVLKILEDNEKNLWVSTTKGICKLSLTKVRSLDSFEYSIKNFYIGDGLQGNEFNESAALRTKDGELFFGGTDGMNSFYPSEIKLDNSIPKLAFTSLRIFNQEILPNQVFNGRMILETSVSETKKIQLKHDENFFSIDFIALTYFFPEKNIYMYQLEGFDKKWIYTDGKKNTATYTNLNHGNYILRVKGSNSDGVWNKDGISIHIEILPPFWKTWYAKVFYFLFLLLVLYLLRELVLYRERIHVKIDQDRKESERIHELDAMKIKFFTNVSHEFRTPLTLILSPVEKLLKAVHDSDEERYLKLIHQNAKRLLSLVNELLDFRKLEVDGLKFNPHFGDVVHFVQETVLSFSDLTEKKNISLVFKTDLKQLDMLFDSDKMEKIMFNLLSNAFKFTPENGSVSVDLSLVDSLASKQKHENLQESKYNLEIKVRDTGIGIPSDKLDKVFIRFFQVESSHKEHGTGIGLALVQEFVKMHRGEIAVESILNEGTCFTIIMPVVSKEEEVISILNSDPVGNEIRLVQVQDNASDDQGTSSRAGSTGLPSLLIAEDNDDLRFYLKDNFQAEYQVLEAANGKTALDLIVQHLPDFIISDIMMPEMDGIELCKKVKTDASLCHIPLILLTAKTSEQQQLEGLATGADDYITKPFNFQILEAKIKNLMVLRKNQRKKFKNKLSIEPKDISITSLDEQFMQKALDLVEKNIANADFTVEEFSRELGISRMSLYKKTMALTGKSPIEFIRILRLKRAALLLQKSQLTVAEVAYRVGFNDPRSFSSFFKTEFNMLPSQYIKQFWKT